MQFQLPFDQPSGNLRDAPQVGHAREVSGGGMIAGGGDDGGGGGGGGPHALEFVRHPRARRYVIRVCDGGTVRVTIPRGGSRRAAQEFADRERAWIETQKRRLHDDRAKQIADQLPPALERELRQRARRELPQRLMELASAHGLVVSRVTVRNQKWRWGSCSRDGHICLNWRLLQMPDTVRDYVMIHELMHLKRMDHSARFWRLVERACPMYREARRFLRAFPRA